MIRPIDRPPGGIRIVLADDHVVMRSGLRLLLETEPGFEIVAEVANAQAAARSVRGHHPDVLILDLNMPGESGLDLIPRMRAEAPGTAIVVLTMQRDPMFARQALRAGAYAYVLKDATDSEVVLAVRLAAKGDRYINPQLGVRIAAEGLDERPDDLSERELKILRLVALGHTNPQIAGNLYLSVRTVEVHRKRILQKLGLSSRVELMHYALDHGVIGPGVPET